LIHGWHHLGLLRLAVSTAVVVFLRSWTSQRKNRPLPSFGNRVTIRVKVGRRASEGSLRTIMDRSMSFFGDAVTCDWMLTNLTQIL
jgi:hypothetical protein